MADPHPHHDHHDPIQDNIDTHPVKLAIGIVIGAFALIVGLILLVQFAVGAYAGREMKHDPAMKPEAVAKRLAPVAQVSIDPNAAPAAAAAPAASGPVAAVAIPAAPAKGGATVADGQAIYNKTCMTCHAAGVAGAPKYGDKAAWAPRVKEGKDHLYAHAIQGKGVMPPKGGNAALSDAEVKAAVDYMLAAAK
jgi:cytochrome c5